MELGADDYVVKVVDVDKLYDYDAATDEDIDIDDYDVYFVNSADARSEELELKLQGRTLYITPGQDDMGLALASDAKAVVIQDENGKSDVKTSSTRFPAPSLTWPIPMRIPPLWSTWARSWLF